MYCPYCRDHDTQVIDSRLSESGSTIRRRRRCSACDKRFTTYERIELALPTIVKKDGSRTEYNRSKLKASMDLALRKRPVSVDQIADAVEKIEMQLLANSEREISSEIIGQWVMNALSNLDKIAYIRFASVYQQFENIADFQAIAKNLNKTK